MGCVVRPGLKFSVAPCPCSLCQGTGLSKPRSSLKRGQHASSLKGAGCTSYLQGLSQGHSLLCEPGDNESAPLCLPVPSPSLVCAPGHLCWGWGCLTLPPTRSLTSVVPCVTRGGRPVRAQPGKRISRTSARGRAPAPTHSNLNAHTWIRPDLRWEPAGSLRGCCPGSPAEALGPQDRRPGRAPGSHTTGWLSLLLLPRTWSPGPFPSGKLPLTLPPHGRLLCWPARLRAARCLPGGCGVWPVSHSLGPRPDSARAQSGAWQGGKG